MATARAACRVDKSTQSNIEDFEYKHLKLAWHVNFEAQTIGGTAAWTVTVRKHRVASLILDTSSGLVVKAVTVSGVESSIAQFASSALNVDSVEHSYVGS